ncbi:MAG: hypothetical protein DMG38_20105 [Acidobacteria bacterium]|nr:MAG: hypothetical protein DMG38_20105 [Acidobacteriota bacterium]
MPESVLLGEKAKVVVRFRTLPDGKLPQKPAIESASRSEKLQKASVASLGQKHSLCFLLRSENL